MVILEEGNFLKKRHSKLLSTGDGPFQVLECTSDNTYKLDLLGEYGVTSTFNISNLSPFDASDDLRTNPSKEGRMMWNAGQL